MTNQSPIEAMREAFIKYHKDTHVNQPIYHYELNERDEFSNCAIQMAFTYWQSACKYMNEDWQPIETAPKEHNDAILLWSEHYVDEDFNASGIIEGFYLTDHGWVGAILEPDQDSYHDELVSPTHWRYKPKGPSLKETTNDRTL